MIVQKNQTVTLSFIQLIPQFIHRRITSLQDIATLSNPPPKYNVILAETHREQHQSTCGASVGEGSSFTSNHQSRRRMSVGIDFISSTKLERRNDLILLISIVVVVYDIQTYQISFSTICIAPTLCFALLCSKWNARIEQKAYLWL